jgi:hypothetical protein
MQSDRTGYGNHGDYIFGWKGDSLKRIVDTACYVNCPGGKQSVAKMNKCTQKSQVSEKIDGCKLLIPCDLSRTVLADHTRKGFLQSQEGLSKGVTLTVKGWQTKASPVLFSNRVQ